MYVFDTNVFRSLGLYYPKRFPTIWNRINELTENNNLISVREVRRELEANCASEHVNSWIQKYRHIFLIPSNEECEIVTDIFKKEQYRGLVKRQNMLKGFPVADPFIIAAAKNRNGCVVTQESLKLGGARIPTACKEMKIDCVNLEGFLEKEKLTY